MSQLEPTKPQQKIETIHLVFVVIGSIAAVITALVALGLL